MTAKPNLTWKEIERVEDKNLCLDDWFPNCDGTRTHPLKVSQILAIPAVKQAIARVLKQVVGEEVIAHSVLGTEIDRAFVRGFNQAIREARQRIKAMGLEEGK